jgi:hypothetical protein
MDKKTLKHIIYTCLFLGLSSIFRLNLAILGQRNPQGFYFDCDNTPNNPCRSLVIKHQEKQVKILEIGLEPSGLAWSNRYQKAIVVSDNYNDLAAKGVGHYVIFTFDPDAQSSLENIVVEPLLTPQQAKEFQLYDLEGATTMGAGQGSSIRDRFYAIGSMSLHGNNPKRDRWQRGQFVQMDLVEVDGALTALNLSPVTQRWLDFRDWLISKSGYAWTGEQIRGRAEGDGINVEALSANSLGNVIIGFRGPLLADGRALALEIALPPTPEDEPVLVQEYALSPIDSPHIPRGAPKTLRGMAEVPEKSGEYYVLLGPKGYEKEPVVLARWNSRTGELTNPTLLPDNFVAEAVTPIEGNRILIMDDLQGLVLIAKEMEP